jgi:hypothetical protein
MPQGRSIAVELDEADGRLAFRDWDDLGVNERFRKLSAKADSLIVFYLAREHAITPEHARSRASALKEAMA